MDDLGKTTIVYALRFISYAMDIVTYPMYLLAQRPWKRKELSARTKARVVASDEKSVTYRSLERPGELHLKTLREGIDTIEKVLLSAARQHGEKPCLGTRAIVAEEDEPQANGRMFKKYVMGEYTWRSYVEVEVAATHFGRGLRELGHYPHRTVVVFSETRAEWQVVAHGCFKQSMPVVTLYATLGEDGIVHAINETKVTLVVTSHDLLPRVKKILPCIPSVEMVIYIEDQLKKADIKEFNDDIVVLSYSEVLNTGSVSTMEGNPPKPDDTALIMYTSGSTGIPKGVIITHRNILACMKAYSDTVPIYDDDVFLGFLPLAHVFELLSESVYILSGTPIGYSTALTLLDTSSKVKKGSKGDASVLRPTSLTAVPLILDRLSKGICDKVAEGSVFRRAVFHFAFEYRKKWMARGFDTPLVNRIVFAESKHLLGDRLRLILSGGAPLTPETHELIKVCFDVQVIQGYGLTETCGCGTVMDRYDLSHGRVGGPTTMCDIKIVNWEEGNYRVTDRPFPRGELVIGGDNISPGYYKLPDMTKEDFLNDGYRRWFRTGDIGEVHADGVIKIIDRKKDLVKLQQGEYVALGKIESALKTCPLVDNICVYGDSSKLYTVALVVPNQQHLEHLGSSLQLTGMSFEQMCSSVDVETAVLNTLMDHAKKCKLDKFEIPAAVKLCPEVWSPDMGLISAAYKLKRKHIQEKYQQDINRMYAHKVS